jgi:hypothetical protein
MRPTSSPLERLPLRQCAARNAPAIAIAMLFAAFHALPIAAQTLEDAEMLQRRELHATAMYGRDTWDQYWEGSLKRANGNIGTVTTRTITAAVGVGITDRLTVLASLPYVSTEASQGVLHGQSGRQDLTVMAKYRIINLLIADRARLKVLAVGGVGVPTTDYTPDFLPMSIGLHSRRFIGRGAVHLQDRTGWFVDGYAERMWRSNVTLDRSTYYTDGQYVASSEVLMSDVADYRATVGFQHARWCIPVGLTEERTLGGGDIRRQDMPFVSNRMNFTMGHAEVMYFLPRVEGLRVNVGAMHTLRGRNVGQSTTIMTGLTYALHL